MKQIGKRAFLAAGLGLAGLSAGSALATELEKPIPGRKPGTDMLGRSLAHPPAVKRPPKRMAKTTKLFLTPPGYPNCIATDPDGKGFWVAEQRHDGKPESVWLLDFKGKLQKTIMQSTRDCTGMTVGGGYIWSGCEGAAQINHPNPPIDGIFQTDIATGKQVSRRQIPFGPPQDGGSTHGMAWEKDKLWIAADRMGCLMRIDPKTWQVDYMFRETRIPELASRLHGIEFDNGFIWQVGGIQKEGSMGYEGYTPGLVKYDARTGEVVQTVEFVPGSCDMHDVAVHDGQLYGVDAGEHPSWSIDVPAYQHPGYPPMNSPSGGYVFKIDLI
ncbi:MAG TPA: hypothetical protein VHV26_11045 [Rhizomicrobium sp.]|nr:hypothetical protein [Rhizomicrobium sp.]